MTEEVFVFGELFEVLFFEFVLLDDGLESFVLFFDGWYFLVQTLDFVVGGWGEFVFIGDLIVESVDFMVFGDEDGFEAVVNVFFGLEFVGESLGDFDLLVFLLFYTFEDFELFFVLFFLLVDFFKFF